MAINTAYQPNLNSMSQWGNQQYGGFGGSAMNNLVNTGTVNGFGQGVNTGLDAANPFSVTTPSTTPNLAQTGNGGLFGGLFDNALSSTDANGNFQQGWASPAIGAATGLAQSWLGFQNLGVAKDQLAFQKDSWNQQFGLQKEEYEYQKRRRNERQANYDASLSNGAPAASSRVAGNTL